ncbi:MAG: 1-(5-phosphoribosyl)-5-((5-phosphoribosylamino)methylideneamino)imidazole-4-carboxamide isomerase [SAR86 cluster bacterium]|uniref:1-(5-phosphoribosyl)-5-((5-phosphoribosylamino)methylideneamino)imidazole-4-carboxamide isomerase n=1 Tax=SAR86 cluster bacterium TaxID=2030880 RepID=A0A2A5B368_9GAMM|nr:MAG: 1-(5-phosphoribosyl)-5-((5-phosphoribosylamino)methylideneamino)imidazole-4-carboxamide isomerase [SAR86 cluster bacterium]
MESKAPTEIKLHQKSATLELFYADGSSYSLSAEFLRIHSPSAEVRGHGKGQEVLQTGKRQVRLLSIDTVGNYAIKLGFDDGHGSGIYSWLYLHDLCSQRESLWQNYLSKMKTANASREPLPAGTQVINIMPSPSSAK